MSSHGAPVDENAGSAVSRRSPEGPGGTGDLTPSRYGYQSKSK